MKKLLSGLFAGALMLGVVACGEEDQLRAKVQELENEISVLKTEHEGLKKENDELMAELEEMEAEAEAETDTPVTTDTPAREAGARRR